MSHSLIRTYLKWGTFGKNPPTSVIVDDVQWVTIKDLSDTHIGAILDTQYRIGNWYRKTLVDELIYRIKNNISIPEVEKYYVQ